MTQSRDLIFEKFPAEILYKISEHITEIDKRYDFMFCMNSRTRQIMIDNGFKLLIDKELYIHRAHCGILSHPRRPIMKISIEDAKELMKMLEFKKVYYFPCDSIKALNEITQYISAKCLAIVHKEKNEKSIIENIKGTVDVLELSFFKYDNTHLTICLSQDLMIKRKLVFYCSHDVPSSMLKIVYHREIEKVKLIGKLLDIIEIPKCKILHIQELGWIEDINFSDNTIILEYPRLCSSLKIDCSEFYFHSWKISSEILLNIYSKREQIDVMKFNVCTGNYVPINAHFSLTGLKKINTLKVFCCKMGNYSHIHIPAEITLSFETHDEVIIEKLEIIACINNNPNKYPEHILSSLSFDIKDLRIHLFANKSIYITELCIRCDNSEDRQNYMLTSKNITNIQKLKIRKDSELSLNSVHIKDIEYFENWYDIFQQYYDTD